MIKAQSVEILQQGEGWYPGWDIQTRAINTHRMKPQ